MNQNTMTNEPPGQQTFGDYLKMRGGRAWIWVKAFALASVLAVAMMVFSAMVLESGFLTLASLLIAGVIARFYASWSLGQYEARRYYGN
jgi:hypothetical protein